MAWLWARTKVGFAVVFFLANLADGAQQEYPRELLIIPPGGDAEVSTFVNSNIEPRHAVAIVRASKGSKRHQLLESVALDEELVHLVAIGIQFVKGKTSLYVHRYMYPGEKTYDGKWTKSAIKSWLMDAAYPPVNRMQSQFAPRKYLTANPFGVVLVVKHLADQTDELAKALEPFAEKFRSTLKFTFFTKTPGTQEMCNSYGVWTNDEIILFENPRQRRTESKHSHVPLPPKYRLEGVTPASLTQFFEGYAAGTWPRYYKPAVVPVGPLVPLVKRGIRELSGRDFAETVSDPDTAVLVVFTSQKCDACEEFAGPFQELADRVAEFKSKNPLGVLRHLTIARIDQSLNEHSELVKGTPWMKYWPRSSASKQKRPVDVELRSVDSIFDFVSERAVDEEDLVTAARSGGAKAAKKRAASSGKAHGCENGDTCAASSDQEAKPSPIKEEQASDSVDTGMRISLAKPVPEAARGYLNTAADLEFEDGDATGSKQHY